MRPHLVAMDLVVERALRLARGVVTARRALRVYRVGQLDSFSRAVIGEGLREHFANESHNAAELASALAAQGVALDGLPPSCSHDAHERLRRDRAAWRAGVENVRPWNMDGDELEIGECRLCGGTLARPAQREEG